MKPKKNDILKNKNTGFVLPENYFSEFENDFIEGNKQSGSGFISPENYFETLDDKIIANFKNTGFKTPDTYFQDIDNNILNKCKESKSPKVIRLPKRLPYVKVLGYAIAASLLLFIGFNSLKTKDPINFETLEITEIESWIDDDLISFNSFDIAEVFDETDINFSSEYAYSDEDIIDYLDDINIENLTIED